MDDVLSQQHLGQRLHDAVRGHLVPAVPMAPAISAGVHCSQPSRGGRGELLPPEFRVWTLTSLKPFPNPIPNPNPNRNPNPNPNPHPSPNPNPNRYPNLRRALVTIGQALGKL